MRRARENKKLLSMLVLMLLFTLTVFVVAGCSGGATKEGVNEADQSTEEKAEGTSEEKAEGEADEGEATEGEGGHEEGSPIATQRDAQLESTKDIKDPAVLYNDACGPCHGADGQGVVGPALTGIALTGEEVKAIIETGKNSMPKFKGNELTDEQIDTISNYVKTGLK